MRVHFLNVWKLAIDIENGLAMVHALMMMKLVKVEVNLQKKRNVNGINGNVEMENALVNLCHVMVNVLVVVGQCMSEHNHKRGCCSV